jgi:hypothetical protein
MTRELHLTSPMMSGTDVLAVQQRLTALGYSIGNADGVYGPTTAAAVCRFEREHDLAVDGVVSERVAAALAATAQPAKQLSSAAGLAALAEAGKHLGITEQPPQSNRTPFGAWFGVDGVAWCNIFVSYCFALGANYILTGNYPGGRGAGVYPGKGCTYVPTTEAWLRVTGMWIGRATPLPGDIAIYNWDGGEPDHIGIVEHWLGNGDFEAIEGNTAIGNNSGGGAVMRRTRNLTQVDGFGRIE